MRIRRVPKLFWMGWDPPVFFHIIGGWRGVMLNSLHQYRDNSFDRMTQWLQPTIAYPALINNTSY